MSVDAATVRPAYVVVALTSALVDVSTHAGLVFKDGAFGADAPVAAGRVTTLAAAAAKQAKLALVQVAARATSGVGFIAWIADAPERPYEILARSI